MKNKYLQEENMKQSMKKIERLKKEEQTLIELREEDTIASKLIFMFGTVNIVNNIQQEKSDFISFIIFDLILLSFFILYFHFYRIPFEIKLLLAFICAIHVLVLISRFTKLTKKKKGMNLKDYIQNKEAAFFLSAFNDGDSMLKANESNIRLDLNKFNELLEKRISLIRNEKRELSESVDEYLSGQITS